MVYEDYWPEKLGDATVPVLTAFEKLERDIWTVAAPILDPDHDRMHPVEGDSAWSESFYEPLAKRMETYVAPDDSPETEAVVGMVRGEISNYRRFGRYYGYTFFLARPRG